MKRLLFAIAVAGLMPVPALAQMTLIAKADFNADSVGKAPDLTLPGPPEGDHMEVSLIAPGTYTVVESAGTLVDQPLELKRESGGSGGLNAGFYFPANAATCDSFVVKWSAMAHTLIPPSFFVLRGPQGRIYGSIRMTGPNVIRLQIGGTEQDVGTWAVDVANSFEWHIDTAAHIQTLLIDGVPVAEDVDAPAPADGDVTYFQFEHGFTDAFTLYMDDIEVYTVDCATTPVKKGTWGRIKSLYE